MQKSKRFEMSGNRHAGWLATVAVMALVAPACSDDDDDDTNGSGARAGTAGSRSDAGANTGGTLDGGAGEPSTGGTVAQPPGGGGAGGEAGSPGGAGASGAATAGAGGDGSDRNVLRPEELPFDQQAFEDLTLPEGFTINVFRQGLGHARMLAVHGTHVYVTQPMDGNVVRLTDADDDGVAETQTVVASDLPMVHGIAFHDDEVFLANVASVFRANVEADGSFGTPAEIISDLPDGGQHPLRTLGISPDEQLYISIGSTCDACEEANPEHATILRSSLAGQAAGARDVFATGLRNTIGFGWHPVSDDLWGMDHGSDWRGDDLPPEELNSITEGGNYGWPYCYGKRQIDPVIQDPPGQTKQAYCATTEPAVLLNQAHQAPIGLAFYNGSSFPEEYLNGAFVAMHGSWNRRPATGYSVVFVPFEDGQPQAVREFVSGFLIQSGTATFGRPAGVTVAPDGALLFSDDTNGIVYRVQYE